MAFTQSQIDSLESAIAEGALTVRYSDKLITYRSLDEMERTLEMMRDQLGLNSNRVTRKYASVSKGL
jgi:hypothetical protein